jgi:hypothetical protein
MDKLDQLIANKQAEIDKAKEQLEKLQQQLEAQANRQNRLAIELETLRQAARLRPSASKSPPHGSTPKSARKSVRRKGGRQRGAISAEWRDVLAAIRSQHQRVFYEDIRNIATEQGIVTKMPNVRERVRSMAENGLLSGDQEIGFLVTAEAVRRFELEGQSEPSDDLFKRTAGRGGSP